MRRYTLASLDARNDVDLSLFKDLIESTIREVIPGAIVKVEPSYYTVSPTPSRGDAIRIGRKLSKKQVLGQYCVKISKLFNGENVVIKEELYGEKKCNGGHF